MGLGLKIVQIAYGVDDIEVGAAEFQERFGTQPWRVTSLPATEEGR